MRDWIVNVFHIRIISLFVLVYIEAFIEIRIIKSGAEHINDMFQTIISKTFCIIN